MITRELFIETIEALRLQTIYDKHYAEAMSVAFSTDVPAYKNDLLKVALVKMLQLHFPPVNGHCEIEHYCWVLDFGKPVGKDADVITAEDFWENLNKENYKSSLEVLPKYAFKDAKIITPDPNVTVVKVYH